MSVHYSEFDPFAAEWLRNLIAAGELPQGTVDERDIREIRAAELVGCRQVHLFAGIGGWPLALRLAGWPDDVEVWTGSCPCQPFSAAGKRQGEADERHLWPEMLRLIAERRPATIFGEQVESADGRLWLAGVRDDLEALGYRVGAADLCAAGASAPHRRQRLFWVADTGGAGLAGLPEQPARQECSTAERGIGAGRMADSDRERRAERPESNGQAQQSSIEASRRRDACGRGEPDFGMGHANGSRRDARGSQRQERREARGTLPATGGEVDPWADFVILPFKDGTYRRASSSAFPLAPGIPRGMGQGEPGMAGVVRRARANRVGRLKGYGNAIVPQIAALFVRAYMEAVNLARTDQ